MPINLPQFEAPKSSRAQRDPFVFLFSLVAEGPPKQAIRLTSNNEDITFGTSTAGVPLLYKAAPMAPSSLDQRADGSLPRFSVTIANIGGDLLRTMDENNYFRGAEVEIMIVHTANLDDPNAKISIPGTVVGSPINENAVTVELASVDLYTLTVPRIPLDPFTCWKGYGSDSCGFDITSLDPGLAILGPCPKSLDACRLRGDLEETNSRERLHPRRWGGKPGMEQA